MTTTNDDDDKDEVNFYEMQKTANLIVLDQVIADLKAGRRAAPQMMQGWFDHIIERLESVSQFQRNDNL